MLMSFVGLRVERLLVIERDGNIGKHAAWKCQCDCGASTRVRADHLTEQRVRSCGCLARERATKHGHCSADGFSPTYAAWHGMIQRCTNPNNAKYSYYGGRGIKVCARWLASFADFLADVGERPSPKLTLDRFPNNDGNYEPGNVRWATWSEQMRNRRPRRTKAQMAEASC